MCLAVPLKIVEIDGLNGVGEVEGLRRRMRLDFIKEPRVGEYVIVHAGFAIERLGEEQAKADIAEWNEVRDALAR
ncbi:MAG TPA: HypC/HybG/HupF family hydrogenase formation chaperone [Candidatus Scatomorpha stercorigallinarum]|nr:HypC/HybG/HupF family hydrogenase formation chaperone [Candidatus Scatomorpha stercorigallinarum]